MEERETGILLALSLAVVICVCGGLFLLISGLAVGVSIPLLRSVWPADAAETALPTITPTPDPGRAVATLPAPLSTPSPRSMLQDAAYEIEQQVQLLRGLEPSTPLHCSFITRDELHQQLQEAQPVLSLAEEDQAVFQALGLYDPLSAAPLDEQVPAQILLAVLDEQHPGQCQVLWEDGETEGWQDEYARAYTRALLYEQFFEAQDSGCTLFLPHYATCLAQRALLEGDAFLLTGQWQRQFGSPDQDELKLLDETPRSRLGQLASFPFLYGYPFVQQTYLEEGWAGVDNLYHDMPETTQSVLHPESSFNPEDEPLAAPQDFSRDLGPGWQLMKEGSLGEWLIRLFLASNLPQEDAGLAAQGWDTDVYLVYRSITTGDTVLVWVTRWQNIPAAYTARQALRDYVSLTHDEVRVENPDEIAAGGSPAARIERADLQTLLILSPDPDLADTLRAGLEFPLRSP